MHPGCRLPREQLRCGDAIGLCLFRTRVFSPIVEFMARATILADLSLLNLRAKFQLLRAENRNFPNSEFLRAQEMLKQFLRKCLGQRAGAG